MPNHHERHETGAGLLARRVAGHRLLRDDEQKRADKSGRQATRLQPPGDGHHSFPPSRNRVMSARRFDVLRCALMAAIIYRLFSPAHATKTVRSTARKYNVMATCAVITTYAGNLVGLMGSPSVVAIATLMYRARG